MYTSVTLTPAETPQGTDPAVTYHLFLLCVMARNEEGLMLSISNTQSRLRSLPYDDWPGEQTVKANARNR
jgi:hypothetical protein